MILLSHFYRGLRSFNSTRLESFVESQESDARFTRVVGRLAHSLSGSYDDDMDTQSDTYVDDDAPKGELAEVELGRMSHEEPRSCGTEDVALVLVDLEGLHVEQASAIESITA